MNMAIQRPRNSCARAMGIANGHHGEILQGIFVDENGRRHRGLITLAFPYVQSAAWAARSATPGVEFSPMARKKAHRAAMLFLRKHLKRGEGVSVQVGSNIPMGLGLGSSTADVVAAVRACARALRCSISPTEIFEIAVQAEEASDGTMFQGKARLVAHREGRVLETFAKRLPHFGLVSFNAAPDRPVVTICFEPARYDEDEVGEFQELVRMAARAIATDDAALLGQIATRSAIINERFLPQPHFREVLEFSQCSGGLGVQVAHSGRVVGIMVASDIDVRRLKRLLGGLREIGFLPTYYPATDVAA
ncbi:GHMP kinase [Ensifer aridi]|uniref:GHMP family kinase ATP-binding protein n=1 Tax=Ensifer aridi TaxID=1708715 RepID=UPI00358EE589